MFYAWHVGRVAAGSDNIMKAITEKMHELARIKEQQLQQQARDSDTMSTIVVPPPINLTATNDAEQNRLDSISTPQHFAVLKILIHSNSGMSNKTMLNRNAILLILEFTKTTGCG